MAYEYYNASYMCRCNRTTKLYTSPTDIMPTIGSVLERGATFVSERSALVGRLVLMHISSPLGKNSENVPYGCWCPREVLDIVPIEEETPKSPEPVQADDSMAIDDYVYIKTPNVLLYKTKDAKTPIARGFKAGQIINVSRRIIFNNNGIREVRYQIADDQPNESDSEIAGYWIAATPGIQLGSTISHNISLLDVNTPDSPAISDQTASAETVSDQSSNADIQVEDNRRLDDLEGELDSLYSSYGVSYTASAADVSLQSGPIGRMTFVHGMPFQYTYITDRRRNVTTRFGRTAENKKYDGNEDSYGHTFARNIAANMPIIILVPGIPKYLTAAGGGGIGSDRASSIRNTFSGFWSDLTSTEEDGLISDIQEASGTFDYFSFERDIESYHNYVNALCQTSAAMMDLKDTNLYFDGRNHGSCSSFDWKNYNTSAAHDYGMFSEVVGLDEGVSFAYDPLSSVSDTITNSTTESQFASKLNSISSSARELQFLLGQGGVTGDMFGIADNEASIDSAVQQAGGLGGVLSRAKDFIMNTAEGFNIRFPEIWSDSSHTRSYDIDMHFITPYATAFCKWRYVLVPFFHLFAMAAPQAPDNMSVYGRPFIIKAFSKGYFNVELGIIESLTWKRFGDGDMISSDGVPTQLDVSISFKDLYHVLTASHTMGASAMAAFFNNTGLMDMLGTLSGVDMNRVGLPDRIALYLGASKNAVMGLGGNFMQHIQDRTADFLERHWFM